MNKIERHSNWSYFDRLDGVVLKNGERLSVRFPDGFFSEIVVRVVERSIPISDHGHTYDGTESFAFVELDHHGVVALVPLVGLEARRI
jgi:hypothetical protein